MFLIRINFTFLLSALFCVVMMERCLLSRGAELRLDRLGLDIVGAEDGTAKEPGVQATASSLTLC